MPKYEHWMRRFRFATSLPIIFLMTIEHKGATRTFDQIPISNARGPVYGWKIRLWSEITHERGGIVDASVYIDATTVLIRLSSSRVEVNVWRDRSKALRADLSSMESQRNEVWLSSCYIFAVIFFSLSCNSMIWIRGLPQAKQTLRSCGHSTSSNSCLQIMLIHFTRCWTISNSVIDHSRIVNWRLTIRH